MVKLLRSKYNTVISRKAPQVETFGKEKAEERFNLDLDMKVGVNIYELKVKIYNTICSLDVQAIGNPTKVKKIYEALGNVSLGEYFATKIVPKLVEDLNSMLNIKEINEKYMQLAREGYKIAKANKVECVSCKDKSATKCLKCKFCKRLTHENCAKKFIPEKSITKKMANPGTFSCKDCKAKPIINADKDNLTLTFENEKKAYD